MIRWLQLRLSLEPAAVSKIRDGKPGIYCLNNGGNIQYLVFNAPEDAFSSISRKNISCLLVRCLVELCRPLLVFYDKDELSSFKVLPNFGQADHQERMFPAIITRLTGEKTNISVKSGFQVDVSQVVPRLDGCDAGLCQNCSAIGCFHASKHMAGKKKYGKMQTKTITNPIKQPLQDLFEKMKVACHQSHYGEDLCFSKDDFLEATQQLHFDLTSVQSIADDPQQVSLDQKMHSTAKLYILENCHLACHFLSGIEHLTEERATLEKHQSDVFEYIGQHAKDAKDESKNRRKTEELLQQAVSPLKNMDAAYGWCLQQIQDSTSVTGEKLQAMTRFILVSGKQDQLTKQLQLASVIGERDYDKVSLEAALKTSSQTSHYDEKSPLAAVFKDTACQEVAMDCLTQLVNVLRKKPQPKQMAKANMLSRIAPSWKSVAATQAKSRGQQTDTQHTPAEEKMELVRLAAEQVKLHINPPPDLNVCFKRMAFNKTDMTLTVKYKMQLQPTCERLHSLYSLELHGDELEHVDQDPDYLPSADIKIRQANVPLQEEENLLFITVLKTGKPLVVIQEAGKQTYGMYLLPANDVSYTALPPPVITLKRAINMLDLDETSRLMVMHLPRSGEVQFYSFGKDFSSAKSYGMIKYQGQAMGTSLKQLRLSCNSMANASNGQVVCLLFDNHTCLIYDVEAERPELRPNRIKELPTVKASLITPEGSHLIIATTDPEKQRGMSAATSVAPMSTESEPSASYIYIYSLATADLVKTLRIESSMMPPKCLESLQFMLIGCQTYLAAFDPEANVIRLCLTSLRGAAATIETNYYGERPSPSKTAKCQRPWNYLDYFHFIYEKFSIEDYFAFCRRRVDICCITHDDAEDQFDSRLCSDYVDNILDGLDSSTRKPRVNFRLTPWCLTFSSSLNAQLAWTGMSVSSWLWRVASLVPVQIARVEANKICILETDQDSDTVIATRDPVKSRQAIAFGLYEDMLKTWHGKVKVLSSMGKQTTGKSYFLNHATGSMFDISGHRCTKGIWMTMRPLDGCLYVILDFEGLGSVERDAQEDILLSVTNATISSMTVFKTEMAFYKETAEMFKAFKRGAHLIEGQELLRGWFYVNVKDVKSEDCLEVCKEIETKIDQICAQDSDNFLGKLYRYQRVVHIFPPFQESQFYSELKKATIYLKSDKVPDFSSGPGFLDIFKTVLANVHCGVWGNIRETQIRQRRDEIRQHLTKAVADGVLEKGKGTAPLRLADGSEVPDEPLVLSFATETVCDFPDKNISFQQGKRLQELIVSLRKKFVKIHQARSDADDVNDWTTKFQGFLTAVCQRREHRVKEWAWNMLGSIEDIKIDELRQQVISALLKNELTLCGQVCGASGCQYPCLLQRHHATGLHNCLGDHKCHRQCEYCDTMERAQCAYPAGHQGSVHNCCQHKCTQPCTLVKMTKCKQWCMKKRHPEDEEHDCGEEHVCSETCDAAHCNDRCTVPVKSLHDVSSHRHDCDAKICKHPCRMHAKNACERTCRSRDHFHAAEHLCGRSHACPEDCNAANFCYEESVGRKVDENLEFVDSGGRDVLAGVGGRYKCGIRIPCDQMEHVNPNEHHCGENGQSNRVHICGEPCPMCSKLCTLPGEHSGRHDANHGFMWRTIMASATASFNIDDEEFSQGQRGTENLMCHTCCVKLGRGHTHLVECGTVASARGVCSGNQSEGRRHCHDYVKIGDEDDIPKDELTHDEFWKHINFIDRTSRHDQENFGKCHYRCASNNHESVEFCTKNLWHGSSEQDDSRLEGHEFRCRHDPFHHVLLLDTSLSMENTDMQPEDSGIAASHPNRLGAALHSIIHYVESRFRYPNRDFLSIIPFNHKPGTTIEQRGEEFDLETLREELKKLRVYGTTSFNRAFKAAFQAINGAEEGSRYHPVIVFLTDGQDKFDMKILTKFLNHRQTHELPAVMLHAIHITAVPDNTSSILTQMVELVEAAFPSSELSRESSYRTVETAPDLLNHYHKLSMTLKKQGGFMTGDILKRPGSHRPRVSDDH
ncbi:uncharacterized protein LOC135830393 [Sycon ciliatum]|uniref:uncharacterized protein LOC135830393 n=1 Tax=Sycon ciliatum TaxID=27933 RepID=UPI0031F67B8B